MGLFNNFTFLAFKFISHNFTVVPRLHEAITLLSLSIEDCGERRIHVNGRSSAGCDAFNFNSDDVMNGSDGFFIALVKMEN